MYFNVFFITNIFNIKKNKNVFFVMFKKVLMFQNYFFENENLLFIIKYVLILK